MNKADLRRKEQLEFLEGGKDIEVGNISNLPLAVDEIMSIGKDSKYVQKVFESGLTANVFKLSIDGDDWTLKKKRDKILVNSIDGQISFLNEVQRRKDFGRLKNENPDAYAGIADTAYASLNKGFILSPWIEGAHIVRFDESVLDSLFSTLYHIETAGLFEYDLSSGNLLLDRNGIVKLFDFGYMYPFEPTKDYNPDGLEQPIFHPAERFESRFFMQYLMDLENSQGKKRALEIYRTEKQVALRYYKKKLDWLIYNNAETVILDWTKSIIDSWQQGLLNETNLTRLYFKEMFRSYVIDIYDDIGGQSCTESTIKKCIMVIELIDTLYDFLKENQGFFWEDEGLDKNQLIEKYTNCLRLVKQYMIKN